MGVVCFNGGCGVVGIMNLPHLFYGWRGERGVEEGGGAVCLVPDDCGV